MRDLKFRSWYGGKMTYVDLEDLRANVGFEDAERNVYEFATDRKNNPVMQYTGLKDRNGREIYEGDIVEHPYYPEKQISNVFYKNGSFGTYMDGTKLYGSDDIHGRGWIELSQNSWSTDEDFEVIGNIYENPDLLR